MLHKLDKLRLYRIDKKEGNLLLPKGELSTLVERFYNDQGLDLATGPARIHSPLTIEDGILSIEMPLSGTFPSGRAAEYQYAIETYNAIVEGLGMKLYGAGFSQDKSKSGKLRNKIFRQEINKSGLHLNIIDTNTFKRQDNAVLSVKAKNVGYWP